MDFLCITVALKQTNIKTIWVVTVETFLYNLPNRIDGFDGNVLVCVTCWSPNKSSAAKQENKRYNFTISIAWESQGYDTGVKEYSKWFVKSMNFISGH